MRHATTRHIALTIALALVLACCASALASGPLSGRTYEGGAPSMGTSSEGHRLRTYAAGNIVLRVSHDGRFVSVRFSSSAPVLYCRTQQSVRVQSTKAASISSGGAFTAKVSERFTSGPGEAAIVQVISGRFSGHEVYGTIHTHAAECSGAAGFSATVR